MPDAARSDKGLLPSSADTATGPLWQDQATDQAAHRVRAHIRRQSAPRHTRTAARLSAVRAAAASRAAPEKHHQPEHQTLKAGFIKLAWMAWLPVTVRKDHGPGHIGDTALKLAIDEVRQPSQKQPDRGHHGHPVTDMKDVQPLFARKDPHRGGDPRGRHERPCRPARP